MRDDALNLHVYPVRTEMTSCSSHVYSTGEGKSKRIIMHETLSQSFFMDEDESKHSIVNKTLLQNCSTGDNEICSTKEYKSEFTVTEQKGAKNEVTYDVLDCFNIFNVFKCGSKILYRIDVSYEREYMATPAVGVI